jgi:serine/threonine protein kinase/dienelactone hydrolase
MPATPHAVFLSYASQDVETARRIADALRAFGIEVWFDREELRGGDAWDAKIRRQIRECALFLPVISQHTQERTEGYFRREWRLAVERMHDMADDAAYLLPVVIDATPDAQARVPDRFRERQWARLPRGDTPPAFAERVRQLLAGSAMVEDVREAEPREIPGWRPAAGETLPDTPWIMETRLGEGGFGQVWLARHATMKERRVFKFCFRADRVRALKRELTLFRVLKERIGAHPHIVRLIDVHFDEPPVYVEMDYVEGRSLRDWCEQQGGADNVPLAARLEIVAQIADALHAAHEAGVIHRDVKPGNILIAQPAEPSGHPLAKLSDFGIGQVTSAEVLAGVTKAGFTQTLVAEGSSPQSGTQLYMAPELVAGDAATPRSDIYSLGVVLFQLLVGDLHRPLTTDWSAAIGDPCLREDLAKCFAGKPGDRFADASMLATRLRSLPQRRAALAERNANEAARRHRRLWWRRTGLITSGICMLALAMTLVWLQHRDTGRRKAREKDLPEVLRLIEARENAAALALAETVEQMLPHDPSLHALIAKISTMVDITTEPAGAEVYVKEYRKPGTPWRLLGTTPIHQLRMARGFYRWEFRSPGRATRSLALEASGRITCSLDVTETSPPGMVRVEVNTTSSARFGSWTGLSAVELTDYFIDRFEVTNLDYQAFVDRGGYSNAAYWKLPFVDDDRELPWGEAMARLVDSTGKPGPATWVTGRFHDGTADLPVTGISWYEAAAYAEFVGKRLPSVYHWRWAALTAQSESLVPLSNFSTRGLAAVGTHEGMSQWGAFDMAGNAKEWCWNESDRGRRYILGGSWNEPAYMYTDRDAQSPFNRSADHGFRCIKVVGAANLSEKVDAPVLVPARDFSAVQPVSDEVFRTFRSLYSYDKSALNARVDSVDTSDPRWCLEQISFDAAYSGERMSCLLYLPVNKPPPYQIVVFFPGATAIQNRARDGSDGLVRFDFIIEQGRAVAFPTYKGTYERGGPPWTYPRRGGSAYRDWLIQLSRDLGRTIDFLETRSDINANRIAYLGNSWGAAMGSILPALEPRLKACVLVIGGFYTSPCVPEVDQANFAPRINMPVLMVNGRYDFTFPYEASQKPMFDFIGTPADRKRHVVYDAGHGVPAELYAGEALEWLDKYLGPVKPANARE